jgi:heterotetrameric sarcosine oxidase gamma subunit
MPDLLVAENGCPGCRELADCFVITLRHFEGDTSIAGALAAQGLGWPVSAGCVVGAGPWLAWRGPQEALLLSTRREPGEALLKALEPGQSETAMAAELSDGVMTFELHGPALDEWLAHLVDASAIPRQPGRASRTRMAEVSVFLLRLTPDRLWLLADRSMAAYVINWLAFSHEGAFGTEARRP